MRKALLAALLIGGAAIAVVAIAQTARAQTPPPPPEPQKQQRRFAPRVTPEMMRHTRISETLYFVDFLWSSAALLLVLGTGISARLRAVSRRAVRWRWLVPALFFVLLSIVTTILE